MTDNLTTQSATPATIPASTVIATDDAGASGHVQIVKLAQSTDGSASPITADADGLLVNLGANNDVTITGTAAISAAALPLPSGASTSAKQDTAQTALDAIKTAVETLDNTVTGSELQVDIVSSALPSGASTAAKQPALGTAGTPSSDVITVQGVTSMTALKVDGSAVTQPVSLTSTTVTGTVAVTQSGAWDEVGINDSGNSITVDNAQLSVVGTGTEAAALRVTIASDSTGLLSVDDNNGSLTVDGTVTANLSATDNAVLDAIAASLAGTLTVTGGGGGVEYTEGATDASITGSAILWEDSADTLRAVSAAKPLPVEIIAGGGSGGTSAADDADFTAGTTAGTPAQGVYESSPTSVTDGDLGTVGITQTRALKVQAQANSGVDIGDVTINNASGASAVNIQDGGNTITVDGTVAVSGTVTVGSHAVTNAGTFAVQVDGAALTSLQLADDVIKTLGTDTYTEASTKGTLIGAVRRDADTTLADTTNEIAPLQVDANGRLKVEAFSGETLPVSLTSTTVTGTVAVTQSGTWDEVGINDSGNSITVDAPVGTPAFVRLSDGAAAITTLPVSLASVPSHAVTNAGTFATQIDGAALTALQLIDNPVFVDDVAFTPATSSVMMAGFEADESATDSVDEGDAGAARMTLDRKQIVNPQPHTAGGLDVGNYNTGDTFTALTNSAQVIKASAGQVYGWYIYNPNSSAAYVVLYDIAAASVTVGTSTPKMVLCIPATAAANLSGTHGIAFATAISIAAATTGGGNTAPTTALEATIFYK